MQSEKINSKSFLKKESLLGRMRKRDDMEEILELIVENKQISEAGSYQNDEMTNNTQEVAQVISLIPKSSTNFFKALNFNLMDYLCQYLKFLEIKDLMISIKNKKISKVIFKIFKNKLSNFTQIEKKELENVTSQIPYKHLKTLIKNNSYTDLLDNLLSYNKKTKNNLTARNIFYIPSKNLTIEYLGIGSIKIFKCNKLIKSTFFNNFITGLKHFEKNSVKEYVFIFFINSLICLNLKTLKFNKVNLYISDLIYYVKASTFIGISLDEKEIYKFKLNDLLKNEVLLQQDLKSFSVFQDQSNYNYSCQSVDIQEYDYNSLIYYFTYSPIYLISKTDLSENMKENAGIINLNYCNIYCVDTEKFEVSFTLSGHLAKLIKVIYSEKYSPEKDIIISISADSEIRVWKLSTRECVKIFRVPHKIKEIFPLKAIKSDALFITDGSLNNKAILYLKEENVSEAFKYLIKSNDREIIISSDLDKQNDILNTPFKFKKWHVSCSNVDGQMFKLYAIYQNRVEKEYKIVEHTYQII